MSALPDQVHGHPPKRPGRASLAASRGRVPTLQLREVAMEQAIRHFRDRDHVFTGHEGEWTMCGKPWTGRPKGDDVPLCQDCVTAAVDYADTMRQGQR